MIIVVFGHALDEFRVGGHYFDNVSVSYSTTAFDVIRTVIYSFHMPLFMSVSGYLFYYEVKKNLKCKNHLQSFNTFISKKIWRLVLPFIFIMYLWRKPISYLLNPQSGPTNVLDYIKFGTTGPLWYLYVLFGIFIIQKLLMWVIWKFNKHIIAALVVFAAFCYVGMFFQSTIRFILTFNFYFFLGALVNKNFSVVQKINKKRILLIVLMLLVAMLEVIYVLGTGSIYLDNFVSVCIAVVVLFMVWTITANIRHRRVLGIISMLDKNGMGIYLLHSELLNISALLLVKTKIPVTGSLVVTTVIGIFAAFLLTEVIRTLHFGMILGEYRPRK